MFIIRQCQASVNDLRLVALLKQASGEGENDEAFSNGYWIRLCAATNEQARTS